MKRKNTEDPLFKLHRKNHQHEPDNLDLTKNSDNICYWTYIIGVLFLSGFLSHQNL